MLELKVGDVFTLTTKFGQKFTFLVLEVIYKKSFTLFFIYNNMIHTWAYDETELRKPYYKKLT